MVNAHIQMIIDEFNKLGYTITKINYNFYIMVGSSLPFYQYLFL